jgi:alkanesulfonate monooxygenase SsuD/methylene tetrahydromethanopterin reductase-like flavin-dependent oxidoreductase (luciferase family)
MLPLQEEMPMAVASQISPSGMTLAGKHGIGVFSIGSHVDERAEGAADCSGASPRRRRPRSTARPSTGPNWRVLLSWHIAETARRPAARPATGLLRWHNEYTVAPCSAPGKPFTDPDEAVDMTAFGPGAVAVIGTPDDLVAKIKDVRDQRRLRHRGRLRARLGEPREHDAQLGHGGPLRGARDQRLPPADAAVRGVGADEPGVLRAGHQGRGHQDHVERTGGGRPVGDPTARPAVPAHHAPEV